MLCYIKITATVHAKYIVWEEKRQVL